METLRNGSPASSVSDGKLIAEPDSVLVMIAFLIFI
jgi:hypothetical protein